jgi:3'(2'), 5'-bisphosphate nucleotidase
MEWDTAAGQVIVTEAGGSVFDMKSKKEMRYNKDELRNPSFIAFSSSRLATSFGFSVI